MAMRTRAGILSVAAFLGIILNACLIAQAGSDTRTKEQLVAELKAVNPSYDGTLDVRKYDTQGRMIDIRFSYSAAVTNISPLSGLVLQTLTLPGNKGLTDLSPLSGMPLTYLNINGTGVLNLAPISGLPLKTFSMGDTSITDISPLSGMSLTSFDCMRNRVIADLSPLDGMPLTNVGFYGCYKVVDITPLAHAQLKSINFENSSIADLSPLHGQPITYARICTAYITDITPLIGMPLTDLDLTYAKNLTDISAISGMTNMVDLRLDQTAVSDISMIRNMTKLTRVLGILNCPNLHDISVIENMNIKALVFTPEKFSLEQMAIVRRTKSLKWIATDWNTWNNNAQTDDQQTCQTAAAFWAKWDAAHPASAYLFYNDSAFDGNDPAANSADDAAIASDKTPLQPGQTATLANYSSYSKGINGVMVDLLNGANVTASDFTFKTGNTSTPASWPTAMSPTVTNRPGAGVNGSHRVMLVWPAGRIKNKWLQLTVKATANTGIAADLVYYFGNAPGESGNSASSARVDGADLSAVRSDPHKTAANPADITDKCDFNRDGRVNTMDEVFCRANATTVLSELKLIAP